MDKDDLDRDDVPETGFVLVRGEALILGYESTRHISENVDELDDFFNSEESQAQRKKRRKEPNPFRDSSVLLKTFFENAIPVKIENERRCGFIGPLAREHLREHVRDLVYKHGSEPEGEWTMLAEIVRVPHLEDDPEQKLATLLEGNQMIGGSMSDHLDQVVQVLNAFQEYIGSASYPDIVVSPVAVYREINPSPES